MIGVDIMKSLRISVNKPKRITQSDSYVPAFTHGKLNAVLAQGADRIKRDAAGSTQYAIALMYKHGACAALLNPFLLIRATISLRNNNFWTYERRV
ncbi:hypothetical protein MKW98_017664 [Papaver atlanticum]|uniref:Uncharacterized protein n=1 Tax=Papaver atlanticum TaxID=357466 RepID=A0AAD4XV27_9MAGN|nr:hypothetical protein MKW98_017664 [Papaver atlanticum]